MSIVGSIESIKCSFCPVAGSRGDQRIMCAVRHFARGCSGGGSGGGPIAKEADEEGGRVAWVVRAVGQQSERRGRGTLRVSSCRDARTVEHGSSRANVEVCVVSW